MGEKEDPLNSVAREKKDIADKKIPFKRVKRASQDEENKKETRFLYL